MNQENSEILYKFLTQNPQLLKLFARDVKASLDVQADEFLQEDYRQLVDFQHRLFQTWKAPMVRLDSMIACALETCSEVNMEYRRGNVLNPNQLNVATRLHARAINIAREISHLLKGGYADGAMARWRSLHENSVIAEFLSQGDENLSVRFLDYQAVIRLKAARSYLEHQEFLDFERISSEQMEKYKEEVDALCEKYGKNFKSKYGWACEKFPNDKQVTFQTIEKYVDLSFLRIHYGFASANVHSGIDSIGYKLGLSMSEKDILLAGPSNEGLTEPFQCTSLSLCQATDSLIALASTTYRDLGSEVLWQMHESMKKEIVEASDAMRNSVSVSTSIL